MIQGHNYSDNFMKWYLGKPIFLLMQACVSAVILPKLILDSRNDILGHYSFIKYEDGNAKSKFSCFKQIVKKYEKNVKFDGDLD